MAESLIPAALLAQWAGMDTEPLIQAIRSEAKPNSEGKFEAGVAVRCVIQYLARQRDFILRDEAAELLEMTGPRISQMVQQGILEQDSQGRLPRRQTIHRLFRWMRERIGDGKTTQGKFKQEQLRLNVELLREDLAKARGETVSIAEAERIMSNLIILAKQKLLGIGNKLAPRIPYLKDEESIRQEIQREIEEGLAELSRPVQYMPDASGPEPS